MSKDEIRNKLFKKGHALLPSYKKLENSKIQKNFLKAFELRKLKNILLYRNIKNEIPTIVGGVFATFAPEICIKEDLIDLVCVGEGENALIDLCEKIEKATENVF